MNNPVLSIIVPAYNEGAGIARASAAILAILETTKIPFEILFIDDGSQDDTFTVISHIAEADTRIKGISLSRNFGKEAAVLAGLKYSKGEAVIVIDADLQHPPGLIPEMIQLWQSGIKIVHAVKRSRQPDSLFKRATAHLINQLISQLGGIDINNSSDFKLLDREIVDILVHQLPERQRFFRGLSSWVGYSEQYLKFDVSERLEDESKWTIWSLMELSITALTSFSSLPLRIITLLGFVTLLLGIGVASEALWSWYHGLAVSGFATIIMTLLIIGSFIMISLGIIGEYIAKIYEEVKGRPVYLVKSTIGF